jgi:ribosome-associated protein
MRKIDVAELEKALDDLTRTSAQARFAHHKIEGWRDQLIAEDSALTAYVEAYPATDRPKLRALIRAARSRTVDPIAARTLFRYLRDNAARHAPDPEEASVPPTVS